jgi:uncharacterized protein
MHEEATKMRGTFSTGANGEIPPPLTHSAPSRTKPDADPAANERIVVLDILRGLALFGMYMVHFNYYEATPLGADPGRAAAFVEQVLHLFFDERFYGIFGMLFGVGFAIQLERSESRGRPFVARYLRRLAALAVFGFIAEGVFGFNVLFGYAVWGVPLLFVRRWPVKALVVLLVLCASSRSIYSITRVAFASARPGGVAHYSEQQRAGFMAFRAARDSVDAAARSGSWRTVVAARVAFMPRFQRQFGWLPNGSFTLFLLGLIAYRLGLFTRPDRHRRMIVALGMAGLGLWAVSRYVLPFGGPIQPPEAADQNVLTAIVASARVGFQLVREQWLAFTYIALILLLVANSNAWSRRLSFLAWPGRLALTNYMLHIVLLEVFFTPHGFGLKIPALLVFPAAIAVFAAQIVFSRWWLARYRYGPLEWIWRCATNWSVQPMRRDMPVLAPPLAA